MNEVLESESILTLIRRESQALYDVAVIRYISECEYMYVGGLECRVLYMCAHVSWICDVFMQVLQSVHL